MALGSVLVLAGTAAADVSVAKKAKLTGRVSVSGKSPNTTYHVWQSDIIALPGAQLSYVDIGARITTDASGNGTVEIPNTSASTLQVGHRVAIGDAEERDPNQAAPIVDTSEKYWASSDVLPGLNGPGTGTLAQAVLGQGSTLLETWDANAVYSLSLNPAEASWVNMGVGISAMGDLQVELTQVTAQTIAFRVLSDPTFTTLDDVHITGVGMNVVAPIGGSVGIQLGFSGSASNYIDGQYLDSFSGAGQYEYQRLAVVPAPGTLALLAAAFGIGGGRRRTAARVVA